MMRRVQKIPSVRYFVPGDNGASSPDEVVLTVDEYEAIRLKDLKGLEQTEAALIMGISQSTFHRLITDARKKVASAIVQGKAIRIEGGSYETFYDLKGRHCHRNRESED